MMAMPPEPEYWPLSSEEEIQEPGSTPPPPEIPPRHCTPESFAKCRDELVELIVSTCDEEARSIYSMELTQLSELEERFRPFFEERARRIKAQEKELA
jgi:hypothetical protein